MKPDEKEARSKYNLVAEYYHDFRTKKSPKGHFYNEMLEMPATLELLGNVKNKKILDFGCGTGILTKILKNKGAEIKGFDISPVMLNIAKSENPNLDLRLGSGYNIPFNKKFDIIVASLVLSHINNWEKIFKQIKRVLKRGGYFIFSIENPVSDITIKTGNKNPLIRKFQDYFKERKIYSTWKNILYKEEVKRIRMPKFHKTYETIIKIIVKNGFEIIDYKDTFPLKESKKLFPKEFKFASNSPYFCVWKVKKK